MYIKVSETLVWVQIPGLPLVSYVILDQLGYYFFVSGFLSVKWRLK